MVNKLWVQLTVAFGLIIFIAVIIVAIMANSQVSTQFRRFVAHNQMWDPARLEPLAEYYAQHNSWEGVDRLLDNFRSPGGVGGGAGMRRGAPDLLLADTNGRVIYARSGQRISGQLTRQEQTEAIPIRVDEQVVGYLALLTPPRAELTPPAQAFLDQLNGLLLQAGLIAGGLGVLLGLAIARGLSAPLARLAAAARHISRGELNQQIPVQGSAEMAELARAFNDMAQALQEAETLRRNIVADIAHELRTPLTVIQGGLQAILDEIYPLEKAEIATIYNETLLLSRLVNDLRELAQAEAGQLSLNTQVTSVATIIESAVSPFEGLIQEQAVTLNVNLPAHLPPVLADPDRVRQVLNNLLSNALRHSPAGGQIIVAVDQPVHEAGRAAPFIRIWVTDTGPGIAPDDLPYVFNRFWRADKSRSRYQGGSGLGLAIALQLVEAQGGQIGVDSEGAPGRGSHFWFTLPVAPSPVAMQK
jgi:two-component system OmpR family sensor kinase/two-component system sensor histidine kinase BaeS